MADDAENEVDVVNGCGGGGGGGCGCDDGGWCWKWGRCCEW